MARPMKILVFRLGAMGDILFTTPVLRGLKAKFPDSEITYLTLKKWRFLLKRNPRVARTVGLSFCDPQALGRLKNERFDLLVNLFETEQGARVCEAITATERRGNRWINGAIQPDEKTGILISRDREHSLRQFHDNLSCAALYCRVAAVEPDSYRCEYEPGGVAKWRAGRFLRRRGLWEEPNLIALHLHSRGSASRNWRPDHALEVVRALPRTRFLVLGYRPDREQTRGFEREPNVRVSYHPMPVQAAMLRHCRLFVGIDSGPRHVASAMGTPLICLHGPTPPSLAATLPDEAFLGVEAPCAPCCEEKCPLGLDCLGRIPTERIVEAIRERL